MADIANKAGVKRDKGGDIVRPDDINFEENPEAEIS